MPSTHEQDESELKTLFDDAELRACASLAIERYGAEIFGFIAHMCNDQDDADDAFAQFCADLWVGLPNFRWQSRLRTWCYTLARHAALRVLSSAYRRHLRPARSAEVHALVAEHQSRTAPFLRTQVKDSIARLREQLAPEDRMLLSLRIDRGMSWREIAQILSDSEADELQRAAATARKRFERLKLRLREMAREQGILPQADE
ncbi:MAG: sigma-70 family RNA polymerase sigma factor [Myxococcota bacterium]|nr:sigma-70 family RNA polymerase sigma factor [Myxococcota bacterium]